MKTEARIFNGVAVFLYITAAVYYVWTDHTVNGADWVGSTALVLSGTLCLLCGVYFAFVAHRLEPRPEDRPDAEIYEGAGAYGFFSPGSYWPFGLALSATIAGIGAVFWAVWLIVTGGVAIIFSVGGLLFEYYARSPKEVE